MYQKAIIKKNTHTQNISSDRKAYFFKRLAVTKRRRDTLECFQERPVETTLHNLTAKTNKSKVKTEANCPEEI